MNSINEILRKHLSSNLLNLSLCCKITLTNKSIIALTDFDNNLEIDGVLYLANPGFSLNHIIDDKTLQSGQAIIQGFCDNNLITKENILSGKYDFSHIEIFTINYNDLQSNKITLYSGYITTFNISGNKFTAEINGIKSLFSRKINECYSPLCRAQFCDYRCKLDKKNYIVTCTVTKVMNTQTFEINLENHIVNYYQNGHIEFITGKNKGFCAEIQNFHINIVTLFLELPSPINIGDNLTMVAGCDKTFETCKNKFNNTINFRGEPHLPGTDNIQKTAYTQ